MTTYTGNNGDNHINGSNLNDIIYGLGGDDDLDGKKGDDLIYGGSGNDEIHGSQGNDTLYGEGDHDALFGDDGNDHLTGGGGLDFLDGGSGFDTAHYSGSILEYDIYQLFGVVGIIHNDGFGADGADLLVHVERLVFADATIDLGVNNAPIAVNDTAATNEDVGTYSSGAVSVLTNDFDFEGDSLTATPGSFNGTFGTLVLNANGTYTYTPYASTQSLAQGQVVQDSFNYTVSDGTLTDTGTLTISITGINDAPVAHADSASAGENQTILVNVLTNDTDVDNGAVLTVVSASAPAGQGTASVVGNQVQWNPGTNFDHLAVGSTATVVVSYTIQDQFGATSSSTVNITVTGSNDGPVANPDTASAGENQTILVNVLTNDTDVDDGAVLTVTAASAPAGQGTASVVGNQVQWNPGTDFDHLAVGATAVVVVSYSIQDEHGSASSSTINITVTGTNDGPVANPDSASAGENQTILVNVLTNDTDVDDGAVLTVTAASAPAGQGTASVVGNQVQWNPGTDFDHLAVGATATVVVNYSIQDQFGATSSSTVNITVTGTNDGPIANPDTASAGENQTILVNVLTNDTDVDDGAVLTVTAASAPAGQGSASVVGNQVEFDPGADFDYLAVGESVVVNVSYSIEDQHGASASSSIAVTVTGTNDAPTIDAGGTTATGSVTELVNGDPDENDFTHEADGTVAFDELDLSDTHSASFTPQGGSYLGTFTLDPVDQPGDSVDWNFSVEDSVLDSLDEGETLTQTYTIEIDDGHGGTATQDVTITITGEGDNVAPDANDDAYDAIGNVTLTVPAGTGVLANDTDDAGVGTGPGQANVTAFDAVSAQGGTVTVNADGSFTYTSAAGFEGTDTFTYTLEDAEGETDVATVTIEVDTPVWFIDNSALGSANTGTQADPFTSIAAFNAAQGTANGPAPGETVYLREGTGTYAEADGINLTAGQTLIGGGQDLIIGGDLIESGTGRPTITTIGAGNHGVELSTNNSLSGFDIGTTTGAGISDGAGTVGTLNVSDVGKSGGGQVVDIDQGGTLNVTLNSAASTGSTGGAIDLNGVSGSFTVAGATTIAGVHSGGGIDVTSSALAVQLAGGGLVSTGSTTGVNFVGNAGGSLAITGGNFDITTTSGSALNAQTGGTISIQGSGNNIATTTGGAVTIASVTSTGVTLESVSSTGGNAAGILLNSAGSGGFAVTGLGSIAGSGGSITGKNGADGSLTQGSAVILLNTSNVSLSNMVISNTQNYGILGNNVDGFTLRDSVVSGTHGNNAGLNEGALGFSNLTGIALLEGNDVSGGRMDNVRIVNSSGSLDLTIQDSASDQAVFGHNHLNGNDSVLIETSGSASLTLLIDEVDFTGARGDLVQTVALGSSVHDIEITNNNFANSHANSAGGGVTLGGGGTGSNITVDYQVVDNTFTGSNATALDARYFQQAGDVRGYIAGNVIGVNDGLSDGSGSASGNGISVGLEKLAGAGDASYTATIVDNQVYDVEFGFGGITVTANGGGAVNPAVVEVYLDGNTVAEMGDGALAAFYSIVGGGAFSGDFAQLGIQMVDNLFDASGADFGFNAVYLDQISADAHYYFPGYAGSPDGEFMGGTASVDLDAFLTGQGNTFINGGFPSFPGGGVDAGFVLGVTGDPFVNPVWFP